MDDVFVTVFVDILFVLVCFSDSGLERYRVPMCEVQSFKTDCERRLLSDKNIKPGKHCNRGGLKKKT